MYALGGSAIGAVLLGIGITLFYRRRHLAVPEWLGLAFWATIGAGAFLRWLQIYWEANS